MKLLFVGLSFALADPVAEPSADCNRIEGSHGQAITCSNDGSPKYVTGLCSSAQTTQCGTNGKKSHEYICCDDYEIQPHRHCYNLYGGYGAKLACTNPNDIVVGGCASGRYEDCASGFREELEAQQQLEYESITPYKSSHFIKCCQSGLVLQRCSWRFGHHGEMVKCQNGDVAHGQCASGANADCKAESNRYGKRNDPDEKKAFWAQVDFIEAHLIKGKFLTGDKMTIADVSLAMSMSMPMVYLGSNCYAKHPKVKGKRFDITDVDFIHFPNVSAI